MKLPIAIALLAVLLVPVAVFAAGEGTAPGSFGAASSAPTVESIEIYRASDNTSVDSMTPQVLYYVKLNITSNNQLKHLQEVKATLYYDPTASHAGPGAASTETCAILTWTAASDTWAIDTGIGGTTWQLINTSCSRPSNLNDNGITNGDWIFYFIPGKVATRAPETGNPTPRWDAQGIATNKNSQSSTPMYLLTEKNMECFIEIAVTGGVNWPDVPLGLTFEDATFNPRPSSDNITITYIANGDYSTDIKSDDWNSGGDTVFLDVLGGDPPSTAGYFALKAGATDNTTSVIVTKAYTHMDETGTITPDVTGTEIKSNRLWLALSGTGILPGLYSGTIWYQIGCR